jgi:hypothetical protein
MELIGQFVMAGCSHPQQRRDGLLTNGSAYVAGSEAGSCFRHGIHQGPSRADAPDRGRELAREALEAGFYSFALMLWLYPLVAFELLGGSRHHLPPSTGLFCQHPHSLEAGYKGLLVVLRVILTGCTLGMAKGLSQQRVELVMVQSHGNLLGR